MKLDNKQIVEANELYKRLVNIYSDKADMEALKKQREDRIKEELAGACDIKNKDGEIQPSRVKMPLVLALLAELYRDKDNSKEIEYEVMQSYRKAIKNREIDEKLLDGFLFCIDEINASRNYVKDAFKDTSLLDKDTLKALDELAREKYLEMKTEKLEEAGYEQRKPKDNSEIDELKNSLVEILKIEG